MYLKKVKNRLIQADDFEEEHLKNGITNLKTSS